MKKYHEVLFYIDSIGIDMMNDILNSLPINISILKKVERLFTHVRIKYSPRNDTGTVFLWQNIYWSCARPEVQCVMDTIHSLPEGRYYLSIKSNLSGIGYTSGSALALLSTMNKQDIIPFGMYKIIGKGINTKEYDFYHWSNE